MYSMLISLMQRAFSLLSNAALPEGKAPISKWRCVFRNNFDLYSALDTLNRNLEIACKELEDLARGGAVVRSVVFNKLGYVKQSANHFGDTLCNALPSSTGGFNTRESDRNELSLHGSGLYRFYITSPSNRITKCGGLGHCYSELCPYLVMVEGKASYEVVYTLSEPILTTDKIYKDTN